MSNLPIVDPVRDAEDLIKKARESNFDYITKDQLNPHLLSSAAKHLLLNYGLIAKSQDNDHIYYLTERGRNFKSFEEEAVKQFRKEQKEVIDLKNSKRIYTTYWFTFGTAIASFVIAIILLILKLKE